MLIPRQIEHFKKMKFRSMLFNCRSHVFRADQKHCKKSRKSSPACLCVYDLPSSWELILKRTRLPVRKVRATGEWQFWRSWKHTLLQNISEITQWRHSPWQRNWLIYFLNLTSCYGHVSYKSRTISTLVYKIGFNFTLQLVSKDRKT